MDEETLEIFLAPVPLVLQAELGISSTMKKPIMLTEVDIKDHFAATIGLMGNIQGDAILHCDFDTVCKIEQTYRDKNQDDDPDLTGEDIFLELHNMIVGRSLMNLSAEQDLECRMTSPRILQASSVEMKESRYLAIFSVCFKSEVGELEYDLAIRNMLQVSQISKRSALDNG